MLTDISAGSDYEQVTTPLIFRPGDGRQCFNIPILPDEIDEGKEDFAVRITFLPGGVVASPHEVTFISILDINGEKVHVEHVFVCACFSCRFSGSIFKQYDSCTLNSCWFAFVIWQTCLSI